MDKDILLINETLQGNKASFKVLVERYQDFVFSITFKMLKNREEAEEAAQDTFLKAYKALSGFEQRSKFATWLYQIAWRTAVDRYRSKPSVTVSLDDGQKFLHIEDSNGSPLQQLERKNVQHLVQKALQRMKPEDAALINLYYLQEQSVKEVAAITGLTESNVKVKLFRLRDTLKNELARHFTSGVRDML